MTLHIYILLAPYAPVAPSSPRAPSSLSPRHSVVDGLNKGILIHTFDVFERARRWDNYERHGLSWTHWPISR